MGDNGNRWELARNIRLSYVLFALMRASAFCAPIVFLYWHRQGLSLAQMGLLEALGISIVLLLEIPSGHFADHYGRRISLITANCAFCMSLAIYAFFGGIPSMVLAEIAFSVGMAFMSGADSALVYDTLMAQNKAESYRSRFGSMLAVSMAAMAFFTIGGSWAAQFDWRYPFMLGLAATLLGLPVALMLREPPRTRPTETLGQMSELWGALRHALLDNVDLRRIILYGAALFVAFMGALIFYQPYFELSGLELKYFGFVYAAFNLLAALGSGLAHRTTLRLGTARVMALAAVLLAAGYLLLGRYVGVFSFGFAGAHQLVRGFYRVSISDMVNARVGSEHRATMLSIQGFAASAAYAVAMPLLGWVAQSSGIQGLFMVLGAVCIVLAMVALLLRWPALESPHAGTPVVNAQSG